MNPIGSALHSTSVQPLLGEENPRKILKKRHFQSISGPDFTDLLFPQKCEETDLKFFTEQAQMYYHEGNCLKALACANKAAAIDPQSYDLLIILGQIHHKNGSYPEARKAFVSAINLDATNFEGHTHYAYLLMSMDNDQKAFSVGSRSLLLNFDQPILREKLEQILLNRLYHNMKTFRICLDMNEYRDIPTKEQIHSLEIQEIKAQLAINPRDSHLNFLLGQIYIDSEDYEEALPHLKAAVKKNPGDVTLHKNLATAYSNLGDPQKALTHIHTALDLSPRKLNLYKQMRKIYIDLENEAGINYCSAQIALFERNR